jgi:hypothetical protein
MGDVTDDTPIGLGANAPNAPIIDTPAPPDTTDELDALLAEFELGTQNQPVDQPVDQNERDRAFAANLDAHTQALQIDARQALAKLAGEFGDKFRRFEAESEIDHEAVAQAVRNSGGKIPADPPPNLGRMSNNELRRHVLDNYGYDPG